MEARSPKLVVTASDHDFDPVTIQHLRDEGYEVSYIPFNTPQNDYENKLNGLVDPLDNGESYAIVGSSS